MGDEQTLSLRKIMEIGQAIKLVEDVTGLDSRVAYRLGRLGSRCDSVGKGFAKRESKLREDAITEQTPVLKDKEADKTGDQSVYDVKLTEINKKFMDAVEDLLDNEKESIKVPEFVVKDFEAKRDTIASTKEGTSTIKAEQCLVPVKFFTLMGELIKE